MDSSFDIKTGSSGVVIATLLMLLAWPFSGKADPIPKPCEHRPGARKAWEGAFCTGNLQLEAPLSVTGIGLVYNSLDSAHQEGFGFGWRLNIRSTLTEDPDGNVVITRPDGKPTRFTRSGNDYLPEAQVMSRLTRESPDSFAESFLGGARYIYRRGSGEVYFLDQMLDRNQRSMSIQRDNQDRETAIVDSYNRSMQFAWNGEWLQSVTDHEGRTFLLETNPAGELASVQMPVVDAGTPSERFTYDPQGRHLITAHISPQGAITDFSYYPDGSLKGLIEPMGSWLAISYTADTVIQEFSLGDQIIEEYQDGALVAIGNQLGEWSTLVRDDRHRVTNMTDHLGDTWSFAYSQNDDLIYEENPDGMETTAEFDDNHNMISYTRRGKTFRYAYDEFNQVIWVTDPLGHTINFNRDDRGNLTQWVDYRGKTHVSATYNPDGSLNSATGPYGTTLNLEYDEFGNVRALDHPVIGSISQKSSPMGFLTWVIDALGDITAYYYDGLGRLIGWLYPADPSVITDGPRADGVMRATVDRDLDGRETFSELAVGGNSRSATTGYDSQTGAINHQEQSGNTLQDDLCPCPLPPPPDGADGGTDGGDNGGDNGGDQGQDGGQDGGGIDGGGIDGGGIDGGGVDGGGTDAGGQDGGGTDAGGEDGGTTDGGSNDGGMDGGDCADAGPVNEQCSAQGSVSCGQVVSGSTGGSSMSQFLPCAPDETPMGGEYVYEFYPDEDSLHVEAFIDDGPNDPDDGIDLDVFILRLGCDPMQCTEWGYHETYFAVHPCDQPYYIVIKGYEASDSGPYRLEIKCHTN